MILRNGLSINCDSISLQQCFKQDANIRIQANFWCACGPEREDKDKPTEFTEQLQAHSLLHCRSTRLSLSISFKPDLAKRGGEIILCQA